MINQNRDLSETICIQIVCNRRTGVWASSLRTFEIRPIRTAGQLRADASPHTLLIAALVSTLGILTNKQLADFPPKPRVKVFTLDASFRGAVTALTRNAPQDGSKRLRAGKNFIEELQRFLNKFDVSFATSPPNAVLLALYNWAIKTVSPWFLDSIPALRPIVASQIEV
jgi:hypothetical protein